jgi:hypothetical protein
VIAICIAAATLMATTTTVLANTHDSSSVYRPNGVILADVTGMAVSSWVGFKADTVGHYALSVVDTSDEPTQQATPKVYTHPGSNPLMAQYLFHGYFSSDLQESVCVLVSNPVTKQTDIDCWQLNGSTFNLVSKPSDGQLSGRMPTSLPDTSYGFVIGDFEGDGFDEILTYSASDGSGAMFWRYSPVAGEFVLDTNIDPANLTSFRAPGGVTFLTGCFGAPDGVNRDDLAIYQPSTGLTWRYDARKPDAGKVRLWFAYGNYHEAANQVASVAKVTPGNTDQLILANTTKGQLQFLAMDPTSNGSLNSVGLVNQGGVNNIQFLLWGHIENNLSYTSTTGCDDLFDLPYTFDSPLVYYFAAETVYQKIGKFWVSINSFAADSWLDCGYLQKQLFYNVTL